MRMDSCHANGRPIHALTPLPNGYIQVISVVPRSNLDSLLHTFQDPGGTAEKFSPTMRSGLKNSASGP